MIPNATRRIITEIENDTAQEHCVLFHASRIFNDASGAFILLRSGLTVEASILVRSTFEATAQVAMLMDDHKAAEAWLKGATYSPGEVRKRLAAAETFRQLYKSLSAVAHPNVAASPMHSFNVADGYAISFGGSYQPKRCGILLAVLVDVILIFLNEFYAHYRNRLSIDFWPPILEISREVNGALHRWVDSLPDDSEALAQNSARFKVAPMPEPPLDFETRQRVLKITRERWGTGQGS